MQAPGALTGRRLTPEQMDAPDADPAEIGRALAYLRGVNRRLGGTRACLQQIHRWRSELPTDRPWRFLDIGTGSADIPRAVVEQQRRRGVAVEAVGVDLHPATLACAREHVAGTGIEIVEANALRLMDQFEPGAFDIVHAGMFLHHLHDIEVMTVLRIMSRLARVGVIWNDLIRGGAGRLGAKLFTIGAPPMVKHDALVSFEAGFTRAEALLLAKRVGLPSPRYRTHLFYRFTLSAKAGLAEDRPVIPPRPTPVDTPQCRQG